MTQATLAELRLDSNDLSLQHGPEGLDWFLSRSAYHMTIRHIEA